MPRPRSNKPYACGPYRHRNKWRIVVYIRRGDGERDRELHAFDTREAAAHFKRTYGEYVAAAGRTVGQAVNEYVAGLERKGNKASSIKTARYRLDAILDFSRALIELTPARAQDYYDDLVDEGGAVDTHRGCLIAAKAFGRFCHEEKMLRSNPFEKVKPIGKKSRGKLQLSIDDARKFRIYCQHRWEAAFDRSAIAAVLPLEQGLRAGEVAQLHAPHVDDRGRLLHVGEIDAKTKAARRLLKVQPWLIQPLLTLAATAAPGGHLFSKEDGTQADRHWVTWHAKRHMKDAGVRVVTAHGLRGTFATLKALNSDKRAVADAMGHTTPAMTEAHYIDPRIASDSAIDAVDDILSDGEDWVSKQDGKVTHKPSDSDDE